MHCRLGMFGKPKQKRDKVRKKSEEEEAEDGEVEQASLQHLASFACETKKGVNPNPRISQMARNHAIADAASEACCGGGGVIECNSSSSSSSNSTDSDAVAVAASQF